MIAYYNAQMSHVVRMCPYSIIQMSQVVKCVRHTNDRMNDHTNESLSIRRELTGDKVASGLNFGQTRMSWLQSHDHRYSSMYFVQK